MRLVVGIVGAAVTVMSPIIAVAGEPVADYASAFVAEMRRHEAQVEPIVLRRGEAQERCGLWLAYQVLAHKSVAQALRNQPELAPSLQPTEQDWRITNACLMIVHDETSEEVTLFS